MLRLAYTGELSSWSYSIGWNHCKHWQFQINTQKKTSAANVNFSSQHQETSNVFRFKSIGHLDINATSELIRNNSTTNTPISRVVYIGSRILSSNKKQLWEWISSLQMWNILSSKSNAISMNNMDHCLYHFQAWTVSSHSAIYWSLFLIEIEFWGYMQLI